jgi:hypothetical protein
LFKVFPRGAEARFLGRRRHLEIVDFSRESASAAHLVVFSRFNSHKAVELRLLSEPGADFDVDSLFKEPEKQRS